MPLEVYQVDSFTDRPFAGNPAGVVLLDEQRDDAWLKNVAREMNLSETAFLLRQNASSYSLRWFTPVTEVDLCGHATLAAAHVLFESQRVPTDAVCRFETRSGLLTAAWSKKGILLDFPAQPPRPSTPREEVLTALGLSAIDYYGQNDTDILIVIDGFPELISLQPDFRQLSTLTERGVIVSCPTPGQEYDFASRFFAPAVGIDEDPVTGSAHCCLGPYWRERLGQCDLTAYQASQRGGRLQVIASGTRVKLVGQAVTVLEGKLYA